MSANLFSLNQSKTEFLLIGLPAQLSKVSDHSLLMSSNVTIIPAKSARNLQSYRTSRFSDIITLQRPSVRSRFKVNRSFTHHAPVLWNSLPKQLRQPSAPPSLVTATDSTPPLTLSSHQFHSKLNTFLFEQTVPS